MTTLYVPRYMKPNKMIRESTTTTLYVSRYMKPNTMIPESNKNGGA